MKKTTQPLPAPTPKILLCLKNQDYRMFSNIREALSERAGFPPTNTQIFRAAMESFIKEKGIKA